MVLTRRLVNMAASAKEKFTAAVNVVRTLPKDGSFQPSREMMLKFYAFYKQATCGSCTDAKPGFWDVIGKAKWDAWSDLQEMSEEDAMTNYVEQLKQIVEAMPHSDSVQTFIEKLGSFYEMVDTNTINSRSSKRNNNDVTKSLEALTEKPFGEGETECAALVGGTNTAQYVAFESTTKHTDLDASTGDSGTVSSDTSSDDEIVSVVSQPQKALSSDDTTHLTNGDTIHCDDASPLTNGDRSVPETSQDTKVTIQDNDGQSVTSQDYDSDTEVYCDTSDLPLELPQCLESPPGREFPSRELDVSLPSYSVMSPTTDVVSATKNNDQVVVKKDPGMVYGRNGSHENETPEYSSRHQTFPVACPTCSMSTSHDTLVQQLATRGGGMEQTEGDGSVPTSTPRIQSTTGRSQQAGPAQQQSPVPAVQHAPFCPCLSGSGGGGDDRWSHDQFRSEVNEQITLALLRLQQDMNTVVARVDTLEVKAERHNSWETTTETSSGRRQSQPCRPWWARALSGRGVLFAIVWPFLVHLFFCYIRRRCRRQIKWTPGKR